MGKQFGLTCQFCDLPAKLEPYAQELFFKFSVKVEEDPSHIRHYPMLVITIVISMSIVRHAAWLH